MTGNIYPIFAPGTALLLGLIGLGFLPSAASIMPSDSSPIIFLGARLKTKTNCLSLRSSGLYHCLIPERMLRVPSSPKSTVNLRSFSEPSFSTQSITVPTRKSSLAKSS